MNEKRLKYIFYLSAALLLIIMLLSSMDAGISCDEILHYEHSVAVRKYFSSGGDDRSSLDTPISNLKYYGQSYDNLITILAGWFDIEDVYRFRHAMSSFAAWLAIVISALFAIWLKNYLAGIIVIVLFAISPTFLGHAQNNLKDIPFAAAYVAGIFFTLKFLYTESKIPVQNIVLLILSYAFCISIRAGGLILICYLVFFFPVYYLYKYIHDNEIHSGEIIRKLILSLIIIISAYLLSIVLWPYALQNPLRNVLDSYRVMAHFPATFREIFEGKVEWSDFMPWYYLIKYMGITIPLIVFSGLILFLILIKKIINSQKLLQYSILCFTVLFPVLFVLIQKSNLYSSWRQFLFVYPGIIILSASGFAMLFETFRNKYLSWAAALIFMLLLIHPLKFMIRNHPYEYIYFNEITGGLKGAYAKFETDYYYVSHTEASEWLIDYLEKNNIQGKIKISATYSVEWLFRKYPDIETSWFRYDERSMYDWDYAIVGNRYINPFKLKNNLWPPKNAINVIYADNIPICAVLERKSKDDYYGYNALSEGKYTEAVDYFRRVISVDDEDEMIFYNFAGALYKNGQFNEADSALKMGLKVNPYFEPLLMYLGNIARAQNKEEEAIKYYEKVIESNRKYSEAYVGLSELISEKDIMKARELLRTCIKISPGYKPAIIALGDTYRESNPDIAKKYFDKANSIN